MLEPSQAHPAPLSSLAKCLQDITEALVAAGTCQQVFQAVLEPALSTLGAAMVVVLLVGGDVLQLAEMRGGQGGIQTPWQDGLLDDDLPGCSWWPVRQGVLEEFTLC